MNIDHIFERRNVLLAAWAILIVVVAYCYSPCLEGPFVYDDTSLVRDNLHIRTLSNFKEWFGSTLLAEEESSRYYRPLVLAAFAADHAIWDFNTFGYHLMNLLWHLLNAGLMAALARRIGWGRGAAYLAAWLFAIHPLHAQAVCYISGRGDVQFLSLSLFACHAFLNAWEKSGPSIFWNLAGTLLGCAAVLTKEMGALILVWVPLLAWLKGAPKRTWTMSAGFLAAGLALVLLARLSASDPSPIPADHIPFPLTLHFQLFFRAIGFYAAHFVAPIVLALDRSIIAPTPLNHFYFWLGLALFATALGMAFRFHCNHQKRALFCLAWAAASFLPVSNLFRLSATAADHWLYAASIGLSWGIALAISRFLAHAGLRKGSAVLFLTAAFVGYWGVRLHARSENWSSGLALYRSNLAQGVITTRILNNYGLELAQSQRYTEAVSSFKEAIRMDPRNLQARANHGFTLFLLGHEKEGRDELETLTREQPNFQQGWLALMFTFKSNPAEMRKVGEAALATGQDFKRVRKLLETAAQ